MCAGPSRSGEAGAWDEGLHPPRPLSGRGQDRSQDALEAMKDFQGGPSRQREGCRVVKGWATWASLATWRYLGFTRG